MSTARLVVGFGLILALTIVLMLLLSGEAEPELEAVAPSTSIATSTTPAPSTTETAAVETSTPPTTTLEQREEEVAAILQELWFGWFDAIYRKDPDALWEVVATSEKHSGGVAAMELDFFESEPTKISVSVTLHEILLDRPDCLVTDATLDATAFRGADALSTRVDVLWPDSNGRWRLATAWDSRSGAWGLDCDLRDRDN